MENKSGTLIVFEGGDGVGKSTQLERAEIFLKDQGLKVLVTKEPGSPHLQTNQVLRQIVKTEPDLNAVERELLFMADAARHRRFLDDQIKGDPNLIVLCDRGYYSHLVYQIATHKKGLLSEKDLKRLQKIVEFTVAKPNYNLIFNADFEIAKQRMEGRGGKDVIESLGEDFLRHVNEEYQAIKKGHRTFIVDANKDVDSVTSDVKRILMKIIQRRQNENNA